MIPVRSLGGPQSSRMIKSGMLPNDNKGEQKELKTVFNAFIRLFLVFGLLFANSFIINNKKS